ncbi:MAG TPA: haloacid dehalogenase-like hydrolase, partial [Gemmatimonadales bacterium]|nr:haloacid dehalogenase-like hydrolase [Gemmatimonadales bacterium]
RIRKLARETPATLVLFDIDGTLLTSAAAGRSAIRRAFEQEVDSLDCFEQVRFDGKTDPQIVRELFTAAGRPERTAAATAPLLERYLVHLEEELAARAGEVRPLPGIIPLLAALEARPDVCLGLLTGNIVRGARLKLEAAGIGFDRFSLGAYGSDHEDRSMLPPIAVERAAATFGRVPVGSQVVIIGDTPADVTCGAGLGVRAVA